MQLGQRYKFVLLRLVWQHECGPFSFLQLGTVNAYLCISSSVLGPFFFVNSSYQPQIRLQLASYVNMAVFTWQMARYFRLISSSRKQ